MTRATQNVALRWLLPAMAVALGLVPGCSASKPAPETPRASSEQQGYPGRLLAVTAYPGDFQWRQRVTATWRGKRQRFDAVLAKDGSTLRLIGLGPMNTPGFVLNLRQGTIDVENHTGQELRFEPRWVLLDIQRAFYPWFAQPGPPNGERERRLAGEQIRERWSRGQLRERRFRRIDGKPPGEIVVRYRQWQPGADAAGRVELHNGWFDYSLHIETLEQQRLPPTTRSTQKSLRLQSTSALACPASTAGSSSRRQALR